MNILLLSLLLLCNTSLFSSNCDHPTKPRVSIITSLYNGDEFIAGFLSDITRQTIFDQCELIIINANSPGCEEPLIKQYVKKFPNIIYIRLDNDPGLYAVWNMAIKMAHADLITNANVDDRRNPESLEMQAQVLEQDPAIDLVYADFYVTMKPNETFEYNTHQYAIRPPEFAPNLMYKCLPGPQPMWRKTVHERYGYFDEQYKCGGDFEMWNRMSAAGSRFKKISGLSGLFYFNPKGLSTDTAKKSLQDDELQRISEKYRPFWVMQYHYFCTAADTYYFRNLLNLIGSIHRANFDALGEIAVFDLGLTEEQIHQLNMIAKVSVHKIELTNPDLLTLFRVTNSSGKRSPGWYAWKFVILKQALDLFPYALWVDSGTTVLKPLDDLFRYIEQTGYFLCTMGDEKKNDKIIHPIGWGTTTYVKTVFDLESSRNNYIFDMEPLLSGTIGVSRKALDYLVMPLYSFTKNLKLFEDDGTTPNGFGTGRHDQTVLSIFAYLHGLTILHQDHMQQTPMYLNIEGRNEEFFVTWHGGYVTNRTSIYNSRGDLRNYDYYTSVIRYKDKSNTVSQ